MKVLEGKTMDERDAMVEPLLKTLPADTLADIINLITLAPSEIETLIARTLVNLEFEDPSPSML